MKNDKLKAYREDYNEKPFFFRETSGEQVRFVAWTDSLEQLKGLVYAAIAWLPEDIDVLFKIRAGRKGKEDIWNRYHGEMPKAQLHNSIKHCERLVFQGGNNQLCVRRNDTGEYIALDDHAVLFMYSGNKDFPTMCELNGFEHRNAPLIFSAPHWHVSHKHDDADAKEFIELLELQSV